jgi:diketogulonate reductase-like aldo/keto reductase
MRKSAVIPAIKEILRKLEVEYIDLMYVHDVNIPEPMDGYLEALCDAVDQGLIREIGISNANLEQTKEAIAKCRYPIAANQI